MPATRTCVETPSLPTGTHTTEFYPCLLCGMEEEWSEDLQTLARWLPLQGTVRCYWQMVRGSKINTCNWQPAKDQDAYPSARPI